MVITHQSYVLGFMFSPDGENVVLIEKTKPLWQSGCLNGVGGKVEKGEISDFAMIREFREETGVEHVTWKYVGRMASYKQGWSCEFFSAFSDQYDKVQTTTEEKIGIYKVAEISQLPVIPNLRFLIPLALYGDSQDGVLITY